MVPVTCQVTYQVVFNLVCRNKCEDLTCALSKSPLAIGLCICFRETSTTEAAIFIIKINLGVYFLSHSYLTEVQDALQEPNLSLVKAGDTRLTSHYRAVKAVLKCLKSILITLQHLHQDSGDLSSEDGGLLTFKDRKSIVLVFAIKVVLDRVCRLALQL